jgi:hypothetical protein
MTGAVTAGVAVDDLVNFAAAVWKSFEDETLTGFVAEVV